MKTLIKNLGRQRFKFSGLKETKDRFLFMSNELKKYHISLKNKEDFDFLRSEIIYQAFVNKRTFEVAYEEIRSELYDSWEHLSHEEKKNYISLKMNPLKEKMVSFQDEKNVNITIPFFDSLLNSLYYNEMIIFERPQYFLLETEFKDKMTPITQYGTIVYQAGFTSCEYLCRNQTCAVVFSRETKCFYRVFEEYSEIYPLNYICRHFEKEKLLYIAEAILDGKQLEAANRLLSSGYLDENQKRRISKMIKKEEKNA